MKRILLIMAAFLTIGANAENVKYVTRNYDYTGFRGISVSSAFEVTIEKSDTYSINLEINSKFEEYLRVKVENGVLKISLENLPARKSSIQNGDLKARICLPELTMLKSSGACRIDVKDYFPLGMNKFRCFVSGASKIQNLQIACSDFEAEVSGASYLKLDVRGDEADVDVSGASKVIVNANVNKLSVDVSGAGKAEVKGTVDELDIEGSGASVVNAENVTAGKAEVDISGASVCKVNALNKLEVELSGASKCYYKDNSNLILRTDISRGSSLKRM